MLTELAEDHQVYIESAFDKHMAEDIDFGTEVDDPQRKPLTHFRVMIDLPFAEGKVAKEEAKKLLKRHPQWSISFPPPLSRPNAEEIADPDSSEGDCDP